MTALSRILLAAAVAGGLGTAAAPAQAGPPWPWVCVTYPCYPTDYPPFLLDQLEDEVSVEFNGPVDCVQAPCPQPPPVTVCVHRVNTCTPR